jgi:hypothetical protein
MQRPNESRASENREYLRIEEPKIAAALVDPNKQKFFAPFFARETTIAEAARVARVSTLLMYRHVKRFEALGLLKVTRSEARRGRAVQYYQTVAKEFFIPAQVLPLETTLEVVERNAQKLFLHNLGKTLMNQEEAADLGTRILPSETNPGMAATYIALKPGENWNPSVVKDVALVETWVNLRVSREEAKALQQELEQIVERFQERSGDGKYLLRLGLTPIE